MSYGRAKREHSIRTSTVRIRSREHTFKCMQCRQYVSCMPITSGVHNRNHCPACLWSRHVDSCTAGDRLSGCRAAMEPIGLTSKRSKNKYATERDGELMLVHRCTGCSAIVINRIAADDSAAALLDVFDNSCDSNRVLRDAPDPPDIAMLADRDRDLVWKRLLGTD